VLLAGALGDLPDVWDAHLHGRPTWLTLAALFEAGSFLGHIVLFNAVGPDDAAASRCAPAPRSTSPATPPRACSPPPARAGSR
jgi:hypothetical protein